jgi:hypothetical protein
MDAAKAMAAAVSMKARMKVSSADLPHQAAAVMPFHNGRNRKRRVTPYSI